MLKSSPQKERLLNVMLFIFFGWGAVWGLRERLAAGLSLVDISFVLQNFVFCLVILLRSPRREMSPSMAGQLWALLAFFSGLAFINLAIAAPGPLAPAGRVIMILANILAVISLITLGRSFGILIARRELKTRGLYGLVRHPMYLSDILLRIGYSLIHPGAVIFALSAGSILLYMARAHWEEKFLGQRPDYVQYAQKVRFRFLPWIY
jgi:protein-S-isoprenylcysteine O-methyltransferase Ste14